MKYLKKFLNILIILAIVLTNFMPSFMLEANAEETGETTASQTIDMSKHFKLYIYYPDNRVAVGSYETYEAAKAVMNTINSTASASATIIAGDIIIDSAYAIVHMDEINGVRMCQQYYPNNLSNCNQNNVSNFDNIMYLYNTPADAFHAHYGGARTELTYIAGSWGVDAAFLEYAPDYAAYKIKISGVVGWVYMDQVTIVPIASYYASTYKYANNSAKVKITATDSINIRKTASATAELTCSGCMATPNSIYTYYPSKTVKDSEYTWYYIKYDANNYGYIASKNANWVAEVDTLLTDTYYYAENNILKHQVHMGLKYPETTQSLGTAPFYYSSQGIKTYYLKNDGSRYLSFDGNYFYTNFKDMIDDYRAGTYTKALNYENPYYAYFMYLPSRSKTNMDANTINQAIINLGKTSNLTHEISYYQFNTNGCTNCGTESILYGKGQYFIDAANTYGVNPLAIYTAAIRESGNGTSAIALKKNNLFGYGASDSNPLENAKTYNSIQDSINEYAQVIGGSSDYTNINHIHYHGTHKGNKLSGTSVYYMSDPYAGESDTQSSYRTDKNSGEIENYANTLGIKNNNEIVSVYAEPSSTSREIYTTKNDATGYTLTNLPFIVIDKVSVYENGKNQEYYKVYTDLSLNADRVVDNKTPYNFENCYGYIKKEDLYVQNNQPVIQASNIEIKQFTEVDLMSGVTANDFEDGNISSKVSITSNNLNKEVVGVYKVSYTVTDSNNFSMTKTVDVTVNPTDAPIINADTMTIPQYTTFDLYIGVTVIDNKFGDITSSLTVISNNVNANVLGEYQVKYKVTNAAGVSTEKTRTVKVIINQKPVIKATNITKYLDDSFDPYESVTATDFEDGDITSSIKVQGSVDTTKAGEYMLTYSVTDKAGQTVVEKITVTIEEKQYLQKDNIFYLDKLLYNEKTKKVDFTGFLIIKGMNNNLDTQISYSIIFENQYNGKTITKNLSRLKENQPFTAPVSDNFTNTGAWFSESLDLSDMPSGNYNVFIRARSGDFETKVVLKNVFFNKNVSSKFAIDEKGYQFRNNYFSKSLPMELIVRENGLVAKKNNPTIDNMYNQLFNISFDGNKLNILASSHNVGGDYGLNADVKRYLMFENVATNETYLLTDVGYITDGPYKITLKVNDGYDKTKAWYKASIDLSSLSSGKYSIIVRTTTKDIDDFGELYDILSQSLELSTTINGKKISITRNKDVRYRIELTVE